jgi:hypothetical protein
VADGFSDDLPFGSQLVQDQSFAVASQHEFGMDLLKIPKYKRILNILYEIT